MKLVVGSLGAALALAVFVAPAGAADDTLKTALQAYGSAAGKISASVPFCGGPAEEVDYFERQVKELAEKAGADPIEWSVIQASMEKARDQAEIGNHHCTEDGGRALATDLLEKQKALQAALN
ncbi:hypothetical protein [uncultured Nisaea sp.]|uniref:hypothetical protein n=1 Tax=uncultured Nisaea sp. TaxID=538215 RepID=UPI0030ED946F|tara:strand:+ start:1288 stop:1656 length:369 start_codon:yes stop_codon:yes gene_type:complete